MRHCTRRTLLRVVLGVAVVAMPLIRASSAAAGPAAPRQAPPAYAAPVGGSGNAALWQWVALPNSGGLQVHCTAANGRTAKVPVTWTADGTVTAAFPVALTVTVPLTADPGAQQIMIGKAFGLAVRRMP